MIRMERHLGGTTELKSDTPLTDQLEERCDLLVSGLAHAQSLATSIAATLNACAVLSKAVARLSSLLLLLLLRREYSIGINETTNCFNIRTRHQVGRPLALPIR